MRMATPMVQVVSPNNVTMAIPGTRSKKAKTGIIFEWMFASLGTETPNI